MLFTNNGKFLKNNGLLLNEGSGPTPPVVNTYTAEYAGNAPESFNGTSYIELQQNTYNIQYSAHFKLGQANRYNCKIGLYKSTEPYDFYYVSGASYSAVSEDTTIVDISGTIEVDTSRAFNEIYFLRDSSNVYGRVSATITGQYYV